mmetsp:Transcript_78678/g.217544  ORF Transcript_78678/g.217544 Transcript_78678/m.217544 type:complete len:241 (-) Transcript_78678:64-786(-)
MVLGLLNAPTVSSADMEANTTFSTPMISAHRLASGNASLFASVAMTFRKLPASGKVKFPLPQYSSSRSREGAVPGEGRVASSAQAIICWQVPRLLWQKTPSRRSCGKRFPATSNHWRTRPGPTQRRSAAPRPWPTTEQAPAAAKGSALAAAAATQGPTGFGAKRPAPPATAPPLAKVAKGPQPPPRSPLASVVAKRPAPPQGASAAKAGAAVGEAAGAAGVSAEAKVTASLLAGLRKKAG